MDPSGEDVSFCSSTCYGAYAGVVQLGMYLRIVADVVALTVVLHDFGLSPPLAALT